MTRAMRQLQNSKFNVVNAALDDIQTRQLVIASISADTLCYNICYTKYIGVIMSDKVICAP